MGSGGDNGSRRRSRGDQCWGGCDFLLVYEVGIHILPASINLELLLLRFVERSDSDTRISYSACSDYLYASVGCVCRGQTQRTSTTK